MMKSSPKARKQAKYVAFLRGINVGGRTLVKMEDLRKDFESIGLQNVKTVLASGNVVFEAPGENRPAVLAQEISRKLKGATGREVLTIVRPVDELRELAAKEPFRGIEVTGGTRLFVTFLAGGRKSGAGIVGLNQEGFRILSDSDGVICSVLEEQPGIGGAELMGAIEKEYGRNVTTRSWNTIERILKIG